MHNWAVIGNLLDLSCALLVKLGWGMLTEGFADKDPKACMLFPSFVSGTQALNVIMSNISGLTDFMLIV